MRYTHIILIICLGLLNSCGDGSIEFHTSSNTDNENENEIVIQEATKLQNAGINKEKMVSSNKAYSGVRGR